MPVQAGTRQPSLSIGIPFLLSPEVLATYSTRLNYTKRLGDPMMTPAHKKARVAWAIEMQYMHTQLDDITCSDDIKWNFDELNGFSYCWEDLSRRQNGGKAELVSLDRKQDSDAYLQTLLSYMVPFAHFLRRNEFRFQQDNASIHTARRV
ncbi:hypothetical protein LEN26_000839 [Aphanomyces euteiches]|nr:hypothetical protein AeMF1_010005 [Aphanomyces euteiches]KAH9162648.1 hypothetical protein LEN26_000839 [Aphanomyces euteiches]KAH9185062.1 hypothetical protein AeNC1_012962 [Aphanomyces euteiches]